MTVDITTGSDWLVLRRLYDMVWYTVPSYVVNPASRIPPSLSTRNVYPDPTWLELQFST